AGAAIGAGAGGGATAGCGGAGATAVGPGAALAEVTPTSAAAVRALCRRTVATAPATDPAIRATTPVTTSIFWRRLLRPLRFAVVAKRSPASRAGTVA